jgi:hypothetical protein
MVGKENKVVWRAGVKTLQFTFFFGPQQCCHPACIKYPPTVMFLLQAAGRRYDGG